MILKKDYQNILFLNIETVPLYKDFNEFQDANEKMAQFFMDKVLKYNENTDINTLFTEKAFLYPEFSRILTISVGRAKYNYTSNEFEKGIMNIYSEHEENILLKFLSSLEKLVSDYPDLKFCGHNIEKFGLPFIIKRLMINNIKIPKKLNITNLKPWELPVIDICNFWDLTSNTITSLKLMSEAFKIEKSVDSKDVNLNSIFHSNNTENKKEIIKECSNENLDLIMEILIKMESLYS